MRLFLCFWVYLFLLNCYCGWGLVIGFPLLFVAVSALVEGRRSFMRIVFMGTPDFAVPSLTSLVEAGNVDCACHYSS